MSSRRRIALPLPTPANALLLAFLLGVLGLPGLSGPAGAQFADATDVVVVEVPVYVTRDGEPVRGLTAADFVIEDNGKKQSIVGFEAIDLYGSPGATPAAAPPIAARRHFLFLFDLAFSAPEAVVRARQAAVDVLDELHPTDVAAVALYSPIHGASFVVGFTSDRRQVELAIGTLGAPELLHRSADPLDLVAGKLHPEGRVMESGDGGSRQSIFDQIHEENLATYLEVVGAAERSDQQSRVAAFSANVSGVADTLAAIEGRKYVVFFSEGFADDLLIGSGGGDLESRRARESGEIWDVSSEEMFGATGTQNDLQRMIGALQRADAVVQAVDIGRLRSEGVSGGLGGGKSSLFAMARDTGGELYENFNQLGDAMRQMLQKTGVTYLLAFTPSRLRADDKPHRLEVEVVGQPRGTRVHHRAGYLAPQPFAERSASEKKLTAAELVLAEEDSGTIDVAVLAAPQPGSPPYYVPVLVELDGTSLLAGNADPVTDVEIFAYAFDRDGGIADHQVQVVGLDLATVGPHLRRSGLKYWGHLDLAPGSYRLRVMARNLRTGEHGARSLDLVVPDFPAGRPTLLPALVPEDPAHWVLIREDAAQQRDVPYPFLVGGAPILPAARPVLPRKGTTRVVLQGFHLADAALTARLLDAAGRPADGATFAIDAPTAGEGGVVVADSTLTTSGVAPGAYRLEWSAGGTTSSLPVTVE